jgi:general L-amino acid transport system permease protein
MQTSTRAYPPGEHPDQKPPIGQSGVLYWVHKNLFSSPFNVILTLLTAYFLYTVLPPLFNWLVVDSVFVAESRDNCRELGSGACWGFIGKRFGQFTYGFYPQDERWRVVLCFLLLIVAAIPVLWDQAPNRGKWLFFSAAFPFVAYWLLIGGNGSIAAYGILFVLAVLPIMYFQPSDDDIVGGETKGLTYILLAVWAFLLIGVQNTFFSFDIDVGLDGLGNLLRTLITLALIALTALPLFRRQMAPQAKRQWVTGFFTLASLWHFLGGTNFGFSSDHLLQIVETDQFGGFMLTMVIGVTGIVVSLPIGILLALGRQSDLHIIRWVCTGFIEFIRGVPLIALLFVASTMLNYFLPPGSNFDLLLRVLIMVVLFSAAYLAEVIRGGLQAIPKGQTEAADAMGLRYWQSMRLIVLPQALKISIPGIVNTFIGLFKDTTLVVIIGLLDPLGIGRASLSDTKWQGLSTEVYVFIALFFFICCFGMSRYSIYLEKKLHTGHREE